MGLYLRPDTLPEALEALAREPLTVLAGGTDFYPARVGRALDDDVLDITAIEELRGIRELDDHWLIGATTTWTDIATADLPPLFRGLQQAAREIGGAQVQNAGTVAGNLCNASPAADGMPPLLCLDATVDLAARTGATQLPLSEFVQGNRQTGRRADQLVTGIRIAKPAHRGVSAFRKLGARRYLVISIVMVAGTLELDAEGRIVAARLAVGACSAVARRLPELEGRLVGRPCGSGLSALVEANDLAALTPIDDARGSGTYRRDAAATLVRRLLADLEAMA